MHHFVRVGLHGQVGRFRSADATLQPRGARVVLRTSRGLEIGEVLSPTGDDNGEPDGLLLRAMTVEDELLAERLGRRRESAHASCQRLLEARGVGALLLDTELLFDGRGLYFHFLGDVPEGVETLAEELSAAYEAEAKIGRFAETLREGCGPGCGTEAAKGQGGCTSCATCAVAGACAK